MIETSGVRVTSTRSRGVRCPPEGRRPCTYAPSDASRRAFRDLRPGSRRIYSSLEDPARQRPYVTIPLPDWLLEANRAGPADLTFVSLGGYGPHSYLLFPVIPPPWSTAARRDGSRELSPASGVSAGSLDWWAHEDSP